MPRDGTHTVSMMNQLHSKRGAIRGPVRPHEDEPSFYFATCGSHATLSLSLSLLRSESSQPPHTLVSLVFYLTFRVAPTIFLGDDLWIRVVPRYAIASRLIRGN